MTIENTFRAVCKELWHNARVDTPLIKNKFVEDSVITWDELSLCYSQEIDYMNDLPEQVNETWHPDDQAVSRLIRRFGRLYSYGRSGATLCPEKLHRWNEIDLDNFDSEELSEICEDIQTFNNYVKVFCARESQTRLCISIIEDFLDSQSYNYKTLSKEFVLAKESLREIKKLGIPSAELILRSNFNNVVRQLRKLIWENNQCKQELANLKEELSKCQTKKISLGDRRIRIRGYSGTWYVLAETIRFDHKLFCLEHEVEGDGVPCLIVTENGQVVYDEAWEGFSNLDDFDNWDELCEWAEQEYNFIKSSEEPAPSTFEMCPHCESEVELINPVQFERQTCLECESHILPCSLCDMDKVKCSECPARNVGQEVEMKLEQIRELFTKGEYYFRPNVSIHLFEHLQELEMNYKGSCRPIRNIKVNVDK